MLVVLRDAGAAPVPLLVASACPGGPLTAHCYEALKTGLHQSLPLDDVLLALHGSASAENAGDLEGDLLEAVRQVVGVGVPVIRLVGRRASKKEILHGRSR